MITVIDMSVYLQVLRGSLLKPKHGPCKKCKISAGPDILRIHGKSAKYIYVDGTPTPAKIQISHSLKVGQFYIDVYSISIIEWQNIVQTPLYQ